MDTKSELEVMAQLNAALDELTRMGPAVTVRVLMWALARYGIVPAHIPSAWDVRDRRPKAVLASAPPVLSEPPPKAATEPVVCPICGKNGFKDRRGLGGHVWAAHHIYLTKYEQEAGHGK